jgi:hypothetical protein
MVAWPHGLGRTSWQQEPVANTVLLIVDRKQREKERKRERERERERKGLGITFKGMPPVTYLFQVGSVPKVSRTSQNSPTTCEPCVQHLILRGRISYSNHNKDVSGETHL